MSSSSSTEVLVVDVDGTLSPVDTLELLRLRWWFRHPLQWRQPLQWRSISKQTEKCELWNRVGFGCDPVLNSSVVAMIKAARLRGARVAVVTGSAQELAEWIIKPISEMVDEVHGSDRTRNLTKSTKADFVSRQYASDHVTYIGDSVDDFHVWKIADRAVVVLGGGIDPSTVSGVCAQVETIRGAGNWSRWCARTRLLFSRLIS